MNIKEKFERLESLKQKYIELRNYILYYADVLENNNKKEKDNIKVKKLILTKKFYGRNLNVG